MRRIYPFLAVKNVDAAVAFYTADFGATDEMDRVRAPDDPDELAARAVAAGAHEMFTVANQPYGVRQGRIVDPFGHHWLIGGALKA